MKPSLAKTHTRARAALDRPAPQRNLPSTIKSDEERGAEDEQGGPNWRLWQEQTNINYRIISQAHASLREVRLRSRPITTPTPPPAVPPQQTSRASSSRLSSNARANSASGGTSRKRKLPYEIPPSSKGPEQACTFAVDTADKARAHLPNNVATRQDKLGAAYSNSSFRKETKKTQMYSLPVLVGSFVLTCKRRASHKTHTH